MKAPCKSDHEKRNCKEADWRVFKKDTEAGRLLSRLYGVNRSASQPQIQYPKPKRRNEDLTKRSRWNVASKKTSDNTTRRLSIPVPKVGKKTPERPNPLSILPRRKTEALCKKTIEESQIIRKTYRPPNQTFTSSEKEKERLCRKFERVGGKCLPPELTGLPKKDQSHPRITKDFTGTYSKSEMANQLALEIQERRAFQKEMEVYGAGDQYREDVVDEITARLKLLMKYDTKVANRLINDGVDSI